MIPTGGKSYLKDNRWEWLFKQAIPNWSFQDSDNNRRAQSIEWLREVSDVCDYIQNNLGILIQNIDLFEEVLSDYCLN